MLNSFRETGIYVKDDGPYCGNNTQEGYFFNNWKENYVYR